MDENSLLREVTKRVFERCTVAATWGYAEDGRDLVSFEYGDRVVKIAILRGTFIIEDRGTVATVFAGPTRRADAAGEVGSVADEVVKRLGAPSLP